MYAILNLATQSAAFTGSAAECMKHYAAMGFPDGHSIVPATAAPTAVQSAAVQSNPNPTQDEDEYDDCPACDEYAFNLSTGVCDECAYKEEDIPANAPTPTVVTGPDGDPVVQAPQGWTDYDSSTPGGVPDPAPAVRVVSDWSTGGQANGYGNTVTGNAGEVSAIAKARQERQQKILKDMGLVCSDPMYDRGMRCVGEGNKRFREERTAWEQAPAVPDLIDGLDQRIGNEERAQLVIPAQEIRMRDDGALHIPGNGTHFPEKRMFAGMLSMMRLTSDESPAFPAAAPFLTTLPPDERAWVFNKQMQRVAVKNIMVHTRANSATPDGRALYAITGPSYAAVGANEILRGVAEGVDFNGARGYLKYNPESTNVQLDALWVPETITDLSAGDVFKFGARFRTNDSGGGSVNGGGVAFQNDCLNLIFVSEVYAEAFRMVHKGSMDDLHSTVRAGMQGVVAGFKPLLDDWGMVYEADVRHVTLWGERFSTVPDALEWAVLHGKLGQDLANKAAVTALLDGYAGERADGLTTGTLTDIVNAITRAAWQSTVDECVRHNMERQAGALVPVLARAVQAEA